MDVAKWAAQQECAQSIVDRRYERQKYFMRRCGLRRLMYLVEGDALRSLASLPVRGPPQAPSAAEQDYILSCLMRHSHLLPAHPVGGRPACEDSTAT